MVKKGGGAYIRFSAYADYEINEIFINFLRYYPEGICSGKLKKLLRVNQDVMDKHLNRMAYEGIIEIRKYGRMGRLILLKKGVNK